MRRCAILFAVVSLWLPVTAFSQTRTPEAALNHFENAEKKIKKGDLDGAIAGAIGGGVVGQLVGTFAGQAVESWVGDIAGGAVGGAILMILVGVIRNMTAK